MAEKVARRLLRLLEDEHAIILNGAFDDLSKIGTDKESLFHKLERQGCSKDSAQRLERATQRNQTLLQAAIRGFGAAREVVTAIGEAKQGSVVYASDGKVSRLSDGNQQLSQNL